MLSPTVTVVALDMDLASQVLPAMTVCTGTLVYWSGRSIASMEVVAAAATLDLDLAS